MIDFAARCRLDGRVVVVTGAAGAIGRATAAAIQQQGGLVVLTDLDGAAAERTAAELRPMGGHLEAAGLDVADEQQVAALMADVVGRHGRLDILVNNAGIGARVPTENLTTEVWDRVLAINLTGAFRCAREAGRQMLERGGGVIVNVASIMGLVGGGLYPNASYHATKGALVNLTRALALEWAGRGVRVNAVAPAFVRTALTEKLLADPAMERAILENTPLGRLVEPDEVAAAIVFLSSAAAAMITGVILPIDGGWTAR